MDEKRKHSTEPIRPSSMSPYESAAEHDELRELRSQLDKTERKLVRRPSHTTHILHKFQGRRQRQVKSPVPEESARRVPSRPLQYTRSWMLSVIDWRLSSVVLCKLTTLATVAVTGRISFLDPGWGKFQREVLYVTLLEMPEIPYYKMYDGAKQG